jgi:hypothetical protein
MRRARLTVEVKAEGKLAQENFEIKSRRNGIVVVIS